MEAKNRAARRISIRIGPSSQSSWDWPSGVESRMDAEAPTARGMARRGPFPGGVVRGVHQGRLGSTGSGDGGGRIGSSGSGDGGGRIGDGRRAVGLGFHPDLPDLRDLVVQPGEGLPQLVKDVVRELQRMRAESAGVKEKKAARRECPSFLLREAGTLPSRCDLTETGHFSPVEDQGPIGSCTAQAVIGLVEYLMRVGGAGVEDMSRMFLYKTTRRVLGLVGDSGAYLRSTIKALALFGVPPEHSWPYDAGLIDAEPEAYHYSFARNFRAIAYARMDGYGSGDTLDNVKRTLLDGFPVAFGFPVYDSIETVGEPDFVIPFPTPGDRLIGGHAVLAVGYDDETQALIIRNSWGLGWGFQGYAFLPYAYVTRALATDFWSVFNRDWLRLADFD